MKLRVPITEIIAEECFANVLLIVSERQENLQAQCLPKHLKIRDSTAKIVTGTHRPNIDLYSPWKAQGGQLA